MNKKDYIGLDLAKKLKDSGFEYYTNKVVKKLDDKEDDVENYSIMKQSPLITEIREEKAKSLGMEKQYYPVFSYYQILTTLAKELFGDRGLTSYETPSNSVISWIVYMLQEQKPQEEIDKYIWDNLDDRWLNNK